MRMKTGITFFMCIIYLSFSIIAYSAEEGFLYQLRMSLNAYGWPEEEITPVMYAAQNMNWESMDNEHAGVVAYSLHYCKRCGTATTSEEKAELAYHLAIAASEMKAIGFEEDVIIRVAINTSREFVSTLNQYRKSGSEEGSEAGIGEMIRERIREQVSHEGTEAQQTRIMERVQNRTGESSDHGKQHHGDGQGGHGPPH